MIYLVVSLFAVEVLLLSMSKLEAVLVLGGGRDDDDDGGGKKQQNVSFLRQNKCKGAELEANERHIPIATKVPAMYGPHPLLLGTKRSSATPPQAT